MNRREEDPMQQRSRAAREILEDAAFLLRPGSGTTPPGYSIESSSLLRFV